MSRRREPQRSLPEGRRPQAGRSQERPEFTFSNGVELLRQFALRVEALTHAADDLHEQIPWSGDKQVRRLRERLGYLIGDAAERSEQLVDACSTLSEEFIKHPQEA